MELVRIISRGGLRARLYIDGEPLLDKDWVIPPNDILVLEVQHIEFHQCFTFNSKGVRCPQRLGHASLCFPEAVDGG